MPGTAINSINYNDDDTSNAIAEALGEVPQYQQPPPPQEPQYQVPPPTQYQQGPPPQYQQGPQQGPPRMPQYEHQYEHPEQQYAPSHQSYERVEHYTQPSKSFTLPDGLKKSLLLAVILILFNNESFRKVLTNIPMTVTEDGSYTIFMTLMVSLIISSIFFLCNQVSQFF